jgi:hypothetical protein
LLAAPQDYLKFREQDKERREQDKENVQKLTDERDDLARVW